MRKLLKRLGIGWKVVMEVEVEVVDLLQDLV
jgi:hypothetical protein